MKANRPRLFMLLSVAPKEMKVVDTIYLGKGASLLGDWEVNFEVANLYGLKKINRHFSKSGLLYDLDLDL
jgi:GTP pyrophosphokinase